MGRASALHGVGLVFQETMAGTVGGRPLSFDATIRIADLVRLATVSSTPARSAPVRSGFTSGLSSRQRFHDAVPARSFCRCSSFATVGRPFVRATRVRQRERASLFSPF